VILKGIQNGWNWYSSFTVSELGEYLPQYISEGMFETLYFLRIDRNETNEWEIIYTTLSGKDYWLTKDITEANARAKMLVYLLENKIINL